MEVVPLKMLTTQISGLLQRISSTNEESIEETARLLAQATVGEGRIIIAGFNEMDAVRLVAMESAESFVRTSRYDVWNDNWHRRPCVDFN